MPFFQFSSSYHYHHNIFEDLKIFRRNMERWQVCGRLAFNCRKCLDENCFFIQFETNHYTCVDKLNGWKDVQRIIAPTFQELCDVLSTEKPTVAHITQDQAGVGFQLFLLFLDIIIFLVMIGGFYVLFMRDRRIFRAISEIPEQIGNIYNAHSRNHNYYLQLRQQGENSIASNQQEELQTNPFLPPQPLALPPPPHEHIEMESFEDDDDEGTITPDSSPEVMPSANYVTKFNRMIRRPNFFQSM